MSTSNVQKEKKKRQWCAERHKWTDEENMAIFNYMKEAFLSGVDFEKPTAPEYYKNFILYTSLDSLKEVPVDKFIQHMKQLKVQYTNTKEWLNQPHQLTLENGSEDSSKTVEEIVKKKCRFFKEFEEVLGGKPQYNFPFIINTSCPTDTIATNSPDSYVYELDASSQVEYKPDFMTGSILTAEIVNSTVLNCKPNNSNSTTNNRKKIKISRKSPTLSIALALESAYKMRTSIDEKRLEWEKEWKLIEFNNKNNQWREEMDFKKLKLDKDFELEKLKIEKGHELEVLKLQMNQQ